MQVPTLRVHWARAVNSIRVLERCMGSTAAGGAGYSNATPSSVRVALCQLPVKADKAANIAAARGAIASAAAKGAELIVLPEVWNSPYATASFPRYAEAIPEVEATGRGSGSAGGGGESTKMLAAAAREEGVWLVGGSIPERCPEGRIYNTCPVFSPLGILVAKHRKVHLFDVCIPGELEFRESDTLSRGDRVTVFDTPFGKVGVGICYDLRFPELAAVMRRRGAGLLVFPGAFNATTGPLHWELLLRARANDASCFVLAASPARPDCEDAYQAWGHSMAVDPWGKVVATAGHAPSTVHATLDLGQIAEKRAAIPTFDQRRGDLYEVLDRTAPFVSLK